MQCRRDRCTFSGWCLSAIMMAVCLISSGITQEINDRGEADLSANGENEFLSASAELQSINSYLMGLGPLSMDPSIVIEDLIEARSLIEAVGDEVVRTGADESNDTGGSHVNCLFGNDPDSMRTILDSLVRASKSCDQESMNFLSFVKSQTFSGQFLNSYSQQLTKDCLSAQAEIIATKAEVSLGKVGSELYELLADLAQAYVTHDRKKIASRGQIVISDSQKSVDPNEILRTLKLLKLDILAQQRLFATSIRDYYSREFPPAGNEGKSRDNLRNFFFGSLIEPCEEITKRWTQTINYPAYEGIPRRTIAETIERRRKSNLILDESVEMVRICRKILDKSNSILTCIEK